MANERRCETCTKECHKAETLRKAAKGGMYATNEFVTLQKKVDSGQLVEVVRCSKCRYADPYRRMDGKTRYYCLHKNHSFTFGQGWCFNLAKDADDFCSYGEKREVE